MVTPGTNLNTQALDETKNNYIMCIVYLADRYGVSLADVSTGEYFLTEVSSAKKMEDEIIKFSPAEIICNEPLLMSGTDLDALKDRLGISVFPLDAAYFDDEQCRRALLEHFQVASMEALGLGITLWVCWRQARSCGIFWIPRKTACPR